MAITSQDVKLYKSEVMADVDSGGGRMTGVEVVDGELNNVFDDTSRDDRVNGRVSLRKVFGAVVTNTRDKYLGAHAIVTDPPEDDRVVVTILDRNNHSDRRTDAQAQVEDYVTAAELHTLTLWDTQPAGSRTLIAYQVSTLELPQVSDILCLSVEQTSNANYGYKQYVRITEMSYQSVYYKDLVAGASSQTKICRIVTLTISQPLEIDFPGGNLVEYPDTNTKPTRVRKTSIVSSANYYGIVPLAEDIEAGETSIRVSTILQAIVPATYSETPLLDQQVGGVGTPMQPCGEPITKSYTGTPSAGSYVLQLPIGIYPGSLTIVCDASGTTNDVTFTDSGAVLLRQTGGSGTTASTGSVTYSSGRIALLALPNVDYTFTVTYTPATAVSDVQYTYGILIEEATRGFNYNSTLRPSPTPGTLIAQYMALGRWYVLQDDGTGVLRGDSGTGTGTINYLTGTVNITTGYQTDIDSYVLFGWGAGTQYSITTDEDFAAIGEVVLVIGSDYALEPGTIEITYDYLGVTKTITDNGSGVLIGDGTGTVNYSTREARFTPTLLPDSGTEFVGSADIIATYSETPTPSIASGTVSFAAEHPPMQANSGYLTVNYTVPDAGTAVIVQFQESGGLWRQVTGVSGQTTGVVGKGTMRGSVDDATGSCTLPEIIPGGYQKWAQPALGEPYEAVYYDLVFSAIVDFSYSPAASGTPTSSSTLLGALTVDFSETATAGIVAGSVLFALNGFDYYDRGGAFYYRDSVGAEITAGTIDYTTGVGAITAWEAGTYTVTLEALLTTYAPWLLDHIVWRTNGIPLRSESFQVNVGIYTATSDEAGVVSTPVGSTQSITGTIDNTTGTYDLTFDPPISPETAKYNAVALTYLPLDAALLGLDPTKLPLDGRVPIFDEGRMIVLINEQTFTLANPVVAGMTYALPRGALASAIIKDATGVKVPTDRYTTDLDVGTVTFANPLDLEDYPQPLVAVHRIEDMCLCTDVQLSGRITVASSDPVIPAIIHDYPASGSYVASAKRYGDLQAQVSTPFDQTAWTNVWSDTVQGTVASASYNYVAYPIVVTNAGAITERWRIEFTSTTAYRVIGETVGQIATGGVDAVCAPINDATGEPYFSIDLLGWGAGWVAGNQLRFNTTACAAAIWLLRCTLQGPAQEPDDSFRLQFRGDN